MKKLLLRVLALVLVTTLCACGEEAVPGQTQSGTQGFNDPYAQYDNYDDRSWAVYDDALGEFYDAYKTAQEADSVAMRYGLMAKAEAKLLGSGVMLPLTSNGGEYSISRVAPKSSPQVLWGNDGYRYHNVVVTEKPITTAHRQEMLAKYEELKGTGEYEAWAKDYLTGLGYTLKDRHTIGYSTDPQTWDVLATSKAANTRATVNTYDGLYEYDCEGVLQPALAESVEINKEESTGFVTYTFRLKPDNIWVDSQGRQVSEVKADDFVAGMQHMMDAAGGLESLVEGIVVGAKDYISGQTDDFSTVGVAAPDDLTVVYTLSWDCPYFMTMLGYGVFAPMSREYYRSQGGRFGTDFDSSDPGYVYGTSPDKIAYCGPYLVTNATARNTVVFQANPSYWNKDNINIKTITWLYNDGEDPLKSYSDTLSGVLDSANLNASAVEKAKTDGVFDELVFVTDGGATTFMGFYNLNRTAFVNSNDGTSAPSRKSDEDARRATAALQNAAFRRAISMATDRGAYNAQSVGEALKNHSLRNSLTPGDFVELPEDISLQVGNSAIIYPAGTPYGKLLQDQLDADGIPITVWDAENETSDGFDGWYDPENAKKELETAIGELKAIGLEISKDKPIYLDLPYFSGSESYSNRANAYKKSVESALGGMVVIDLIECVDSNAWYYAGYYINSGDQGNYDIYDVAGWGPDYGDPQAYLDTFLPGYTGYMTMMLGIF